MPVCRSASFAGLFYLMFVLLILQGCGGGGGGGGSSAAPAPPGTNPGPELPPEQGTGTLDLVGMNVAGAEFTPGVLPGIHGTHYFFPPPGYFQQWRDRGIRSVRFPIRWERLQPVLGDDFDPTYAGLIDNMLSQAANAQIDVILDIHDYGRYRGNLIGSPEVPYEDYQNLLERVALRWRDRTALYGYDIMNEPAGIQTWPTAAQAAINGIRRYDMLRPIFIESAGSSSATNWPTYGNDLLDLEDPADYLIFSAHLYLDEGSRGTYPNPPGDAFDPMTGVRRASAFVEWLRKNYRRGHIGEFGVPGDDPRWLEGMDNLLAYLQEQCIPMAYWAAGHQWRDDYPLLVEPGPDGEGQPQWEVLSDYVGEGDCSVYGPPP
ncbi:MULTISPECIES: glycoside hydrolase family 5 protein [Pseudomonas]|uniref:glycoside hydrolase family 5 protein n=1 Tax=Pseudomonas TaxID=286 RepID=UPI0013A71A90|nr:cellulase family glycosylhydrolase [Pseudomonas sp. OIL-1]QIB49982.1 glycoside hydrolase family 5 protein [Pseudomonas sp. OIL-1]